MSIGELAALYAACEAVRAPPLAMVKDATEVPAVHVFAGGEADRLTGRMRTCAEALATRVPRTDVERNVRFVALLRWELDREAFGELPALHAENERFREALAPAPADD